MDHEPAADRRTQPPFPRTRGVGPLALACALLMACAGAGEPGASAPPEGGDGGAGPGGAGGRARTGGAGGRSSSGGRDGSAATGGAGNGGTVVSGGAGGALPRTEDAGAPADMGSSAPPPVTGETHEVSTIQDL